MNFGIPEFEGPATYAAIGQIVSWWALVEEQTFEAFIRLADQPREIAAIQFYAFRNYSEQLKLVYDLYAARVPDAKNRTHWKTLYDYTKWLNSQRNFVVHNPVLAGILVDAGAKGVDRMKPTQGPRLPLANPYKPPRPPKTLKDLQALEQACKRLHTHLLKFSSGLSLAALPNKPQPPWRDPILEKYNPERAQRKR